MLGRMPGMSESRIKSDWQVIAGIIVLAVLLLGLYVGGYFATTTFATDTQIAVRRFTYDWQEILFTPALKIESWMRGLEVIAVYPDLE